MKETEPISKPFTEDSKYIQQHLANERTFLAWLRTAIAIIGIGFLVINLHYSLITSLSPIGNLLAKVIGIASVILGIVTIILATIDYFNKSKAINNQTFLSSKTSILTLAVFVIFLAIVFGAYFLIV